MKTISKGDWKKTPSGYKSIMHGRRYILMFEKGSGTVLAPVRVKGMRAPSKKIHRHY